MADERRDSLDQLTDAARAASKVAKIVQAAQAGGVAGAAAQTVKEYHKQAVVVIVVVLLLPILLILSLPAVVFGSLLVTSDTVLTDEMEIAENVIEIKNSIGTVLQTAYEDVLAEIEEDSKGRYSTEVVDPVGGQVSFNALEILSMYCAHMGATEYLNIISRESKRLAALSNSVLTLSRIEAQAILTDTAPFPLAEQLRQAALLVEQKWKHTKNIVIETAIPEDDECTYTGSEELLKEVWVNLLDNAVKFSPEGCAVTLSLRIAPDAVFVTVTDHGPGIDKAVQAHIFDQFYQGDTSHKTEGNGLGLAMVKKIVALHGGCVTVNSRPGQGSAFTVQLPSAHK